MAGKQGMKSEKETDVSAKHTPGFLEDMDGRTEVSRTLRQRLGALVSDLGGLDALSYQERSLCKRVIHLERLIEKRELSLAHNGIIDESGYFVAINVLNGLFTKLGLKRRAKTLSLKDYLNAKPEPQLAPSPAPSGPQPKEDA